MEDGRWCAQPSSILHPPSSILTYYLWVSAVYLRVEAARAVAFQIQSYKLKTERFEMRYDSRKKIFLPDALQFIRRQFNADNLVMMTHTDLDKPE